jgi:glycosyltransferase involved in cell wall biosynthesis
LSCWFEKGKLFYLEFHIRLFFQLLVKRADILSSVDLDTLLPCSLVARIRSKKLVFDAHEYFTEVPEVTERKWIKRIWELVAQLCVPHTDAAYTVGECLAEVLTQQYRQEFKVVRNVPLTAEAPKTVARHTGNRAIILYQGALNEGRGLEQLIDAMPQIDAVLWIAGEGDLSSALRKRVDQQDLLPKISFLGFVSPEELKSVTQRATIGINLLQSKGLSYYYSLSNKFFDYIHAGIPQVCAPFPEYERINATYPVAMLCACEVPEIAHTINTLLHDAMLYTQLQSGCLNAKTIFNWEQEEHHLLKIYADACP